MTDALDRETVDYIAITRLGAAYADAVTRRAWSDLDDLFAPGATVTVDTVTGAAIELVGARGVGDFIAGAVERFEFFEMVILNTKVDIGIDGDADRARARLFTCELRQDVSNGHWSNAYGVYHDEYARRDGRWWFASRRYQSLHRAHGLGAGDLSLPTDPGVRVTYRVIQWATGGVGQAAIEGVLTHPDLELVGCWVHSAAKNGRDVGELIGRDPIGIAASNDIDEVLAIDADCVVYSPVLADPKVVARILRSGKNLVTPVGWVYPQAEHVAELEAAAREGGVTLHGTGIHPGGITERFPLMISALSNAVTHVRAEEFSDIRTYAAPDVVRDVMLFGKTPEEARSSIMTTVLGQGFKQSVRMVAAEMGFAIEPELRTTHEVAVATAPIDTPIGVIEPGLVAAQRFRWEGLVNGKPVIVAAVNWFMGQEHLDPAWTFGPEGERFEVEITGDPPVLLTFHHLHPDSIEEGLKRNRGIVATAMHCVNSVPYVCRAEPGIRTYLDLPLIAGRAAPGLR